MQFAHILQMCAVCLYYIIIVGNGIAYIWGGKIDWKKKNV